MKKFLRNKSNALAGRFIKKPESPALAQSETLTEELASSSLTPAPAQATIRCEERKMLELDHLHMVRRGGAHEVDNLTLHCRFHNQVRAEILLGRDYMAQRRIAAI